MDYGKFHLELAESIAQIQMDVQSCLTLQKTGNSSLYNFDATVGSD